MTLENPHVIKPSQIFVGVLKKGPASTALNSSYTTRNDPAYCLFPFPVLFPLPVLDSSAFLFFSMSGFEIEEFGNLELIESI